MDAYDSYESAARGIRHLAYPNVLRGTFLGCGRYVSLPHEHELGPTYAVAQPDSSNISDVQAAALLLAPELSQGEYYGQVYETWDDALQSPRGDSLELAYLLASIRCARPLRLDNAGDIGDIWCTGSIKLSMDYLPFLKTVNPAGFDVKLEAFLAQPEDRTFLVPAVNLTQTHIRACMDHGVAVLSLKKYREALDASAGDIQGETKLVIPVVGFELSLLVETLFEPPSSNESSLGFRRPQEFGVSQPIWHMSHLRNLYFTGRANLLTSIRERWRTGQPAALPQVLHGLGGIGKTQLAVEYAYRYAAAYSAVFWVGAEEPASLAADYVRLAEPLQLPERTASEQAIVIAAVRRRLEQLQGWLLVFDNAVTLSEVHEYLPRGASGHVLITSRNRDWGSVATVVSVDVFERAESIAFLLQRTEQQDEEIAGTLADLLGDLPLALSQATAYIESTGTSLLDYLDLLQNRREELWMEERPPADYPHTIATTWSLAIERVQQESPASVDLLTLCAHLSPDELPRTLVSEGAGELPSPLATTVADRLRLNRAIAVLRRYALIEVVGDTLSMHRLMQVVVRDRLAEDAQQDWIETVIRFMLGALARAGAEQRVGSILIRLIPHTLAVARHATALPTMPQSAQQELKLLHVLGGLLLLSRSFTAPEVEQTFHRTQLLCQEAGIPPPQRLPVLLGLRAFYLARGWVQQSYQCGEHMLTLAEETQDQRYMLEAYHALGVASFFQGNLVLAHTHFEQGSALYRPVESFPWAHDPGVACLAYKALSLWVLGYPEQAVTSGREALSLAQKMINPFSQAGALLVLAVLYQLRREEQIVQELIEFATTLASGHRFRLWEVMGAIFEGWVLTVRGQEEAGIEQIRQSLITYRILGAEITLPYYFALLAETYRQTGQVKEGLATVEEALEVVHRTDQRLWEAELYRLKGELLLEQDGLELTQVESYFQQARDVARCQKAMSLELRAAISLGRLWRQQGKQQEARQLLAEIYDQFTEGFDTTDLQELKMLLGPTELKLR